jgi:hypothetical protein
MNDDNIIDLRLKAHEKYWESPEGQRKEARLMAEHYAAYEALNPEINALITLQPAFEGSLAELGPVDEDAAMRLASLLYEGMIIETDDSNVWETAKAELNLPTLARAAQMLRIYEAEQVVRDLLKADGAKHPDKPA